jgi:hypothetical protein
MLDIDQPLKSHSRTKEDHGMTREVSSLVETSLSQGHLHLRESYKFRMIHENVIA